ncbi:MAG: recombinase family protein [Sandaracinaceae bacterium]
MQVREARAWVEARGAVLPDEFVYREDARSRAEFKKRPQLFRMLADANAGKFDAIVMRDESRLGGDMLRTGLIMQELFDAGVRLFYYFTNEEVSFDKPTDKLVVAIRNFASEMEREKISSRVHEHLKTKASDGFNAGGRVYGYDNKQIFVEGPDGKPRKLRTEYVINEREAAVIVWTFESYAKGLGLRAIATKLNEKGERSPRAGRRGTGSWAYTTVNSILCNRRYLGLIPWNRMEKTYRGGTRVRIERPRDEWMEVPAPQLRIVSDELWAAAQARRPGKRLDPTGKRVGRPPKYLLSGLLRCGECGGPVQVCNSKDGKETIRAYTCAYHRDRGSVVCTNERRRPMDKLDAAVTNFLAKEIVEHGLVEELMAVVRRRLEERMRAARPRPLDELTMEATRLQTEMERLLRAIKATNGEVAALYNALQETEGELKRVEAELKRLAAKQRAEEPVSLTARRLEQRIRERLQEMRLTLTEPSPQARETLALLFPKGLHAFPVLDAEGRKRWQIEGSAVFGPAILGEEPAGVSNGASPGGFEPPSSP